MVTTAEALNIALAIFVPGFIIQSIRVATHPIHNIDGQRLLLTVLTFGAINLAVWNNAIILAKKIWVTASFSPEPGGIYYIVSPVITSVLLVLLVKGVNHFPKFRKFILLKGKASTAWDFAFSSRRKAAFVIVNLKSGNEILGLYGLASYASTAETDKDIYLQRTCTRGRSGKWRMDESIDGIYISQDVVETIKFIPTKKKEVSK